MKKLIILLSLIPVSLFAQTNIDNTQLKTNAVNLAKGISESHNLTVALYPMYAPDIVVNGKKDTFGLGVAFLTPASVVPSLQNTFVGDHAFAGLRFDYLAHEAFASTVGVGMKGTVTLWNHDFTGFAHAGVNIPFSGFGQNNVNIGAMAGGGGYTTIWQISTNATLMIQGSAEKWTQFPGAVLTGGPVFNWSF